MKRGVIIFVGILVVVGLVLLILTIRANRKDKTPQESNLSVWLPYDEVDIYQELSKQFLVDNPTTRLTVKYIEAKDAKEYEAKVVDEIANGRGPDIWVVRNDWIPKHAAKSLPAFTADKKTDVIAAAKARLLPSAVDANTYQGKLYGWPLFGDTLAIIYNVDFYNRYASEATAEQKAVLARLAVTWEDLKTQVAGISRSRNNLVTRSAIALGTAENTHAPADMLGAFLTQGGVTVLTEDGKNVNFNLAVFKQGAPSFPATDALSYYTSFATPGQPNFSWTPTMGDPLEAFLSQKTGALIGYYSTLNEILAKKPTFKIQVGPMVQKEADLKTRVDYGVTWSHIVSKESSNGSLAWAYLSYLANTDVIAQYGLKSGHLTTQRVNNSNALETTLLNTDRAAKTFAIQMQTMKSFSKPEWQQVDEILQDAIKQVTNSAQTAQNSVDSAAERLKTFIVP